jgi:hypothetical protein
MPFTPSLLDSPTGLFDEDFFDSGAVLSTVQAPELVVVPSTGTLNGGSATLSITATLTNSSAALTASVSGGGTLSTVTPTSGVPFIYTAPAAGSGTATVTVSDATDALSEPCVISYAGGFVNPLRPNLPDFLTFLVESVQIPTAALPTNDPFTGYAFDIALATCISGPVWCGIPGSSTTGPSALGILYTLAVYNLGVATLFQITPDQSGQTYFADARNSAVSANFPNGGFGLNQVSTGLVQASSDEGTSATLVAPTWAAGLTVGQLQLMKTYWGQQYLSFSQSYGPTIVGLT